ncbi:C-C chemokine receptor type 5-like [Actinia tenebrosa]|uniref:C-C chemokine receptor type 5-like n=1 Tax=Actinia tenebrosa TaxID=6105 RepID=A0A6P8I332_ACTTE|nr:C-C chemokine receptor type 5-like [Actinia tenebrosa]
MTNNSSNVNSQDIDGQINGWNRRLLISSISIWAIFFLISFIGNTWVSILCCKRLHFLGIKSYYFFSLALADLIFTLSTLFYVLNIVLPVSIFNNFTCKLFYYAINTSHGASVFNLLLLTYNRYVAVMSPLRAFTSQTKSKVRKTLLMTWFLALFPYSPLFFLYNVNKEKGESRRQHCSQTSSPFITSLYYALVTFFMYLMPLMAIIVAYSKICIRLSCTTNRIGTLGTYRRRKKAIKLLVIIVTLFFILWTPFNVMLIVIFVFKINFNRLNMAWAFSTLLVLVNASINPWLYLIMSRRTNGSVKSTPRIIKLEKL